jgi:hypothetical protein
LALTNMYGVKCLFINSQFRTQVDIGVCEMALESQVILLSGQAMAADGVDAPKAGRGWFWCLIIKNPYTHTHTHTRTFLPPGHL